MFACNSNRISFGCDFIAHTSQKKRIETKRSSRECVFSCLYFLFLFKINRFHSNYHHHGGWNPTESPPESVTSIQTTLNNNNNNSNNSVGATIAYRDGQFSSFEPNCHMDTGSPNSGFYFK